MKAARKRADEAITIDTIRSCDIIQVQLAERSYAILIGEQVLDRCGEIVARPGIGHNALIVADENVAPLYGSLVAEAIRQCGLRVSEAIVPAGEESKSLAQAGKLYDAALEAGLDRRGIVVALGGGVIGDLAGFIAATYLRGISFIQVPTTLLAMVDSAVGGKVGVDHPKSKNAIGAFHQPLGVLCNVAFLGSLPERELRSGLAEVVKYGFSMDADFFAWLESNAARLLELDSAAIGHAVRRSCELKASVVERDERETTGLRSVLNFGHTFGHALETTTGYRRFAHGEAVAIGSVCAARLAANRQWIAERDFSRMVELLGQIGLPTAIPSDLAADDVVDAMRRDKKNADGRIRLVLTTRLGAARLVDDASEGEIRAALIFEG